MSDTCAKGNVHMSQFNCFVLGDDINGMIMASTTLICLDIHSIII